MALRNAIKLLAKPESLGKIVNFFYFSLYRSPEYSLPVSLALTCEIVQYFCFHFASYKLNFSCLSQQFFLYSHWLTRMGEIVTWMSRHCKRVMTFMR